MFLNVFWFLNTHTYTYNREIKKYFSKSDAVWILDQEIWSKLPQLGGGGSEI